MSKYHIIGVSGGSGSGKTFFANALAQELGEHRCAVLQQDSYYIDQSHKFDFDGGSVNFDHPNAIDFDLLAEHLHSLKRGLVIHIPIYDFATHSRQEKTLRQQQKEIIIVDGILILSQEKVREHFDISIFVETPERVRFERRLTRDVVERGRTEAGVRAQFEAQVKPMHDLFVEPSKAHACTICSGTDMSDFNKTLNNILTRF